MREGCQYGCQEMPDRRDVSTRDKGMQVRRVQACSACRFARCRLASSQSAVRCPHGPESSLVEYTGRLAGPLGGGLIDSCELTIGREHRWLKWPR